MKLYKDDLIKYRELKKHENPASRNIGIFADRKDFKHLVKETLKSIKFDTLIVNKDETKYTVIIDDVEICYIRIDTLEDLQGLYFNKYI